MLSKNLKLPTKANREKKNKKTLLSPETAASFDQSFHRPAQPARPCRQGRV